MRTLIAVLTSLMLFATPVAADSNWGFKDLVKDYYALDNYVCSISANHCSEVTKALEVFHERDNLSATYLLGLMHYNDWAGDWWGNEEEAVRLWEIAAREGHANSLKILGDVHTYEGNIQDYVKAFAFYSAYEALGHSTCYSLKTKRETYRGCSLKDLQKEMTPKQLVEGKELAKVYVEKYVEEPNKRR